MLNQRVVGAVPQPARLRIRAKVGLHLTYRTHLDMVNLEAFIRQVLNGIMTWHSITHHISDASDPYEHTHFACGLGSLLTINNARMFDFTNIHPNIKAIKDEKHAIEIYRNYHNNSNAMHTTQSEASPTPLSLIATAIDAPTLLEACNIMGVTARSVSDVNLLRNAPPAPVAFEHREPLYAFTWSASPGFTCEYWVGPSNAGKTQCALWQFTNPCLVRGCEDLKKFQAGFHDGIVFDEFSHQQKGYDKWTVETMIILLDWEEHATIPCLYRNVVIPKETKKIFCSNRSLTCCFPPIPLEQWAAIRRRVKERTTPACCFDVNIPFHPVEEIPLDVEALLQEPIQPDLAIGNLLVRGNSATGVAMHDIIQNDFDLQDFGLDFNLEDLLF